MFWFGNNKIIFSYTLLCGSLVVYNKILFGTDIHMPVTMATILRNPDRLAVLICKFLDLLLNAQHVVSPNGY